jgi:phenylalanyl-tRNA synthetase beta chain
VEWHRRRSALANPLSAELARDAHRAAAGLVSALQRNAARQAGRVRLFELGNVFQAADSTTATRERGGAQAPIETQRVAAAICGDARHEQWGEPARKADFHDLRATSTAWPPLQGGTLAYRPSIAACGHPGRSADVLRDGERIGWIGQLHPRLQRALGLDHEVLAFEVDLAPLSARALPRAGEISRFPSVRRDLAFVVADTVPWAAVADTVRAGGGPVAAGHGGVRSLRRAGGGKRVKKPGYGLDFAGRLTHPDRPRCGRCHRRGDRRGRTRSWRPYTRLMEKGTAWH